jgi:hypothetical protein
MRSRDAARNAILLALLLVTLLLVNVATVAVGEDDSQLTVANLTGHFVHIFIEGQDFLYVAPDRSVTYAASARPDMLVEVVYSPGQGVRGSLVDTVPVPYRGSTTACSCQDDDSYGECIYEPPSGGSARFEVFADDMIEDG